MISARGLLSTFHLSFGCLSITTGPVQMPLPSGVKKEPPTNSSVHVARETGKTDVKGEPSGDEKKPEEIKAECEELSAGGGNDRHETKKVKSELANQEQSSGIRYD